MPADSDAISQLAELLRSPGTARYLKKLIRFLMDSPTYPVRIYPRSTEEGAEQADYVDPLELLEDYDWIPGSYKVADSSRPKNKSVSITVPLEEDSEQPAAAEGSPSSAAAVNDPTASLSRAFGKLCNEFPRMARANISQSEATTKILHEVGDMVRSLGERLDTQNGVIALMSEGQNQKPSMLSDPNLMALVTTMAPAIAGGMSGGFEKKLAAIGETLADKEKRAAVIGIGGVVADALAEIALGAYERYNKRHGLG